MNESTGVTTACHRRALTIGLLSLLLAASSPPAAATASATGLVGVRFSDDCITATVDSTRPVHSITAVFNNDKRERLEGRPDVVSYVVKVGPNASESGLSIATLYVKNTGPARDNPPGKPLHGRDTGFACTKKAGTRGRPGR